MIKLEYTFGYFRKIIKIKKKNDKINLIAGLQRLTMDLKYFLLN